MGLLAYAVAGGGFILIGVWESLNSLKRDQNRSPITNPSSPITQIKDAITSKHKSNQSSSSSSYSSVSYVAISVFYFLFVLNSLISLFDAFGSRDRVGSVQQLQVLAIAALFLLYSILGFLASVKNSFTVPGAIINLILLFGFVEEFYLFYSQRKDTSGIENRYYDLILVPILICAFSTILELKSASSISPKLVRAIGLILQGTWFIQMGLSFYTNLLANGCSLHEKSRGNFTIKCKGHSDYHRARAIATLQFNCHLALMVVLAVILYSVCADKRGDRSDFSRYRPIGSEVNQMGNVGDFTLESDEDDEIKEEGSSVKEERSIVEMSMNGFGS